MQCGGGFAACPRIPHHRRHSPGRLPTQVHRPRPGTGWATYPGRTAPLVRPARRPEPHRSRRNPGGDRRGMQTGGETWAEFWAFVMYAPDSPISVSWHLYQARAQRGLSAGAVSSPPPSRSAPRLPRQRRATMAGCKIHAAILSETHRRSAAIIFIVARLPDRFRCPQLRRLAGRFALSVLRPPALAIPMSSSWPELLRIPQKLPAASVRMRAVAISRIWGRHRWDGCHGATIGIPVNWKLPRLCTKKCVTI